ncbi:MAG: DUF1848 domain-containing protein [Nitrospinota bacterium]|jgi:hypothetical protein|nr:DUF1848 domain-containing protein [Nitrospinota bacterium]MDP7371945.1 DUF1848 domain-containing protein [Nitrospinota bacterium]MDP7504969.1 DUF1848 domain-containing protein [Nitrospinota bacterium]MDP7664215.1 DUF1848 domain-containing protein [Nitrospinota bacterium]HJP14404.1 DUF1848 domain-containing protein [Nitrospinota bacterium]
MEPIVVSASRRTDIPAFHARWFFKRLEEDFAEYRNPFNGKIHRLSLAPEDVRAFVFWTRNPAPLMANFGHLEVRGTPFYFLYTINAYPPELERSNPSLDRVADTFRGLSGRIGPERVRWRYDPIVLTRETDFDFHKYNFEKIARCLEGAAEVCIFSFMDLYGKVRRNMAPLPHRFQPLEAGFADRRALVSELAGIGGRYGIRLLACCEDDLTGAVGGKARCVDPELIGQLAPSAGKLSLRPSREECGCAASRDIGGYNICPHGCVYCYANASPEAAARRYCRSDPALPMI